MKSTNKAQLGRRDLLALGAGLFVVGSLPFALRKKSPLLRRTVPVMGTLAEIAVVSRSEAKGEAAIDAALRELRFVDRTMSRFKPDSDIGRANRSADDIPVEIGPDTARVVAEGLRWAEATAGAFDPCLGRASQLWDVTHRRRPPAAQAVRDLAGRAPYRHLDFETTPRGARVHFREKEVALDLGGIAKGYAVDLAVQALRKHGITQALVNVGGDLYALGRSEDGYPWRIGVRSPQDPMQLSDRFDLEDRAAATSGDYERFFKWGGRRYSHLLDPATGAPRRTTIHSITVVAPTCMTADAAATAAFGLKREEATPILKRRGARIVA